MPRTHTTIFGWPFFANNDLTIDCKRRLLIRDDCTFQINAITKEETKPKRTTMGLCLKKEITLLPGRQEFPYCILEEEPEKYRLTTGIVEPSHYQKGTKGEHM